MLTIVLFWEATKDWLAATFHTTHWTLHVVVGLALFLLLAKVLRRPLGSWMLLLPIAVLEGLNEAMDFTRYLLAGWPWQAWSTMIEIALTLVPPATAIAIAKLLKRRRSAP